MIATVHDYIRLRNSKDGNPRYTVIWGEDMGSAQTAADSAVNFQVPNLIGQKVKVTLGAKGEITHMEPVA